MARHDLRKQITIYPPDGKPGEKHSLLNARDLISHKGWSTSPQHADQFKAVDDIIKEAKIEETEDEIERQALLNQPVDTMTLPQLHAYAEIAFGTKIDKRLNKNKTLDRLQEIADASNFKLKFSDDEPTGAEDGVENGTADDDNEFPIAEEDRPKDSNPAVGASVGQGNTDPADRNLAGDESDEDEVNEEGSDKE